MLDLDRIDELDKDKDSQVLGKMIETAYHSNYGYLERLAIQWEQNVRFYEGDQYIYYNETIRNYEPIPITKYNTFIPRPITNLLLPIEQTLTSLLTKNKPSANISPNSDDELDIASAKIAERIVDAKWEIDDETLNHIKAAKIMQLCGTVFREDAWDYTKGGSVTLPMPGQQEETIAIGDNSVKIHSPFEIIPDKDAGAYFIKATYEPVWWVKQAYNKTGNGFTGLAAKIKPNRDFTNLMTMRYRLKNSSGIANRGIPSEAYPKDHVVLLMCYVKPTPKHPKGLMIVFAGGRTLYCSDSPYYDDQVEDSWHPFSWCFWQQHPMRWHGLSLFEFLVPIQKRINSIDSLIILNRMLNVSPQWIIPKGSSIPEGYITGAPGLQITANAVGSNGLLPQRLPGMNLAGDVWKERQDLVTELHMIAGDNEVIQGQRPEGVNTLGGLNLLLEQSYSKFSPLIQGWEKFIEKGQQKKLLLIARRYQEDRPKFTKKLQYMNKDNLDVEINSFLGSSMRDNIDVRIEAGSSLPKSKAVHQDNLTKLQAIGLLGDLSPQSNPLGNQQFLEEFGVTKFDLPQNADVRRGRFIITVLKAINEGKMDKSAYPMSFPFDNLMLYKQMVEDAMKTPGFVDKQGAFKMKYDEIMKDLSIQNPPPPPPMELQGMPSHIGGEPPPQAAAQQPPMMQ